ncbi:MAG: substrate-binding domain-containing protein [Acidiferrobacterales bacterium]
MTPHHTTQGLRRLPILLLLGSVLAIPLAQADSNTIRLATTTSTENSGLLRVLLPPFEQRTRYKVHVIAVGTGKALRMARDGDVDVIIVHAPAAEREFVRAGYGVNRRDLMYNDFVIVGPKHDPAGIRGAKNVAAAMTRLALSNAMFISRGDESGTHKKERELWRLAGVQLEGRGYREAGQGMGRVLQIAGELQGYTLTDRGTWLAMRDKLPLQIMVEGDTRLFNPYGIMAVNPARYPDVNYAGAMALIAWVTSVHGQQIVGDFEIGGEALFKPLAAQTKRPAEK